MGKKAVNSAGGLLDDFVLEYVAKLEAGSFNPKFDDLPSGAVLRSQNDAQQVALLAEALERIMPSDQKVATRSGAKSVGDVIKPNWEGLDRPHRALVVAIRGLLNQSLPLSEEMIIRLLDWPQKFQWGEVSEYGFPLKGIIDATENFTAAGPISPRVSSAIRKLVSTLGDWAHYDGCKHAAARLEVLLTVDACRATDTESKIDDLLANLSTPLRLRLPFTLGLLSELLKMLAKEGSLSRRIALLPSVLTAIEKNTGSDSLSPDFKTTLRLFRGKLAKTDKTQRKAADKLIARIDALCDDSILTRLKADEGWADRLRVWVEDQEPPIRNRWEALLREAVEVRPEAPVTDWRESTIDGFATEQSMAAERRAKLARTPAATWREQIATNAKLIGRDKIVRLFHRLLSAVPDSKPGTLVQHSTNREMLRGLLWLSVDFANAELVQAILSAAKYFYRNNSPLGEASTVILFQIGTSASAAALASLALAVKSETQRELLQSACELLAENLGVDSIDLGDDGIPSFGFTEFGALKREFETAGVELRIGANRNVETTWTKHDGNVLKSVPAVVKREHLAEVDSLKATAKAVRDALGDLASRLEASLLSGKTWRAENWRQQFIEHYVAGTLGRRIVWQFEDGAQTTAAIWRDGSLVDSRGNEVRLSSGASVSLWHPMSAAVNAVHRWREYLESTGVTQPFKQAHREVYILTDGERITGSYSNRFAAHILRQAQFRQLAKARGWSVGLAGPWDGGDGQRAERKLIRWKMRAEFWVNGTGDELQTGLTYVATDQVRFYPTGETEPLPLDQVPPLVFSEIMRDVDLFVGVASVGNDPNWADGGPGGQYREYWQGYSFGELSATAQTRKALLERLVPRLKIAERCSLADRFLKVRGDIRTYKIHLGSGNILMEPNDQYLCIVPKQTVAGGERVHLPFEGDSTLSIILSKAFLLADDSKIKDPTIVSQLKR